MKDQYYLIREDVLPYVVSKVLKVKASLKDNQHLTVQEAVQLHDCSRSAFYKYRDTIFPLEEAKNKSKEFTIILFVTDRVGMLATILDKISQLKLSVLTIHQSIPIDKKASITLSLSTNNTEISVYDIINTLRQMENVLNVDIIGMNMQGE